MSNEISFTANKPTNRYNKTCNCCNEVIPINQPYITVKYLVYTEDEYGEEETYHDIYIICTKCITNALVQVNELRK